MRKVAPQSVGTVLISCLAAAAGDALYRWWRHGALDWLAVAEFALGWALAALVISLLAGMRKKSPPMNQDAANSRSPMFR